MSARDQMSMMLNELMGPSRNDDVDRSALNYKDDEVCKFHLVAFCPHELFVNTKADIGPCPYYHDENLRIAYRNSRDFERLGYERSFYRFLCKMHDDMVRKIQKNKERLALTQGQVGKIDEMTKDRLNERIERIAVEMSHCLDEAEKAGVEGDLEKSQRYVRQVEELRMETDKLRRTLAGETEPVVSTDPNAPKPMEVCETCGCFLIIGDVQQRIDEHYSGKQHVGFAKIKTTMQELKERITEIDRTEEPRRKRSRSRSRERYIKSARSHKKSSTNSCHLFSASYPSASSKRSRSRSRERDRHDRRDNRSSHRHRRSSSRSRTRRH